MKKRRWAIIAFAVIFAAAYVAMGYCIPAFRIKLEADGWTYFLASLQALAPVKLIFSTVLSLIAALAVYNSRVFRAIKKRACFASPLFYVINFLQILTELVSGSQVFFVKIVRRGAAADIQPAHDLPAEIVGHEVKRSVRAGGSLLILIGHRGEENGLLFAHQRFIVGVKAVDDRLELGVEVKIIDRRDEDDRIGLGKVRLSSFMSSASNVHSLVRTHLSQPMQGCTSLNAASKRKTSCPALSAPRWN